MIFLLICFCNKWQQKKSIWFTTNVCLINAGYVHVNCVLRTVCWIMWYIFNISLFQHQWHSDQHVQNRKKANTHVAKRWCNLFCIQEKRTRTKWVANGLHQQSLLKSDMISYSFILFQTLPMCTMRSEVRSLSPRIVMVSRGLILSFAAFMSLLCLLAHVVTYAWTEDTQRSDGLASLSPSVMPLSVEPVMLTKAPCDVSQEDPQPSTSSSRFCIGGCTVSTSPSRFCLFYLSLLLNIMFLSWKIVYIM